MGKAPSPGLRPTSPPEGEVKKHPRLPVIDKVDDAYENHIQAALAKRKDWFDELRAIPREQLTDQQRSVLGEMQSLEHVERENRRLLADIAAREDAVRHRVRDKVVIIGWAATAVAFDYVPTSLHGKCPGAAIHGVIYNGIMTGHLWRPAPAWANWLLTLTLGPVPEAGAATAPGGPRVLPRSMQGQAAITALGTRLDAVAARSGVAPGQHGGWLGNAYDPLLVGGDPAQPNWSVPALSLLDGISGNRMLDRRNLLREIDGQCRTLEQTAAGIRLSDQQQRAFDLLSSPGVRSLRCVVVTGAAGGVVSPGLRTSTA